MVPKRCKGVHCVDLGESFPTSIYLQNLASIQPRTSPVKFASSSSRKCWTWTSKFQSSYLQPRPHFDVMRSRESSLANVLVHGLDGLDRCERLRQSHPDKRFEDVEKHTIFLLLHHLRLFFSPRRPRSIHIMRAGCSICNGSTWGICNNNNNPDLYAESGQTLQGSFSAVSKPNLQVNIVWIRIYLKRRLRNRGRLKNENMKNCVRFSNNIEY